MFTPAHRQLVSTVIELRKKAGLTQRDLAKLLGREQNYVARIETGQRRVDLVEWIDICRACQVDPAVELTRLIHRLTLPLEGVSGKAKPQE